MMKLCYYFMFFCLVIVMNCNDYESPEQLVRYSYHSSLDNTSREYYVYLPKGYYSQKDKKWPVILFLHGDGERGNGLDELAYTRIHGPLYEAWAMKKNLPFVLIVPQLPMFGRDTLGISYLQNRSLSNVPKRFDTGVPTRAPFFSGPPIQSSPMVEEFADDLPLFSDGWNRVENDLLAILDTSHNELQIDPNRIYLTGLSYGGFGTWYMGSKHPKKFAAIAPVVAWGHPQIIPPIAKHNLPIWVFAGGKDLTVEKKYFYKGMAMLESLGHTKMQFTIHEDLGHDAWKRVYTGDELYNWLLSHSLKDSND